jgi:radical SAM protein with 4Fe4S-binding SPASM domain
MLRPDLLEVVRYAAGKGLRVAVAACGMLLDVPAARALREAGVGRVSISIDGATPATHDAVRGLAGSFDACLKALDAAKAAGLGAQVNTTVARHNLGELPAIAEMVRRLGVPTWNPFLLVPTGRGRDLANEELSAEEYERTLLWLADLRQRPGLEVRVTCAPHFQRILRQRGRAGCRSEAITESPGPEAQELLPKRDMRPPGRDNTHGRDAPWGQAGDTPLRGHAYGRGAHATGCMGGKGFAFISHTGIVQICGFLDVPCGDLRATGYDFRGIWRDSAMLKEIRLTDAYRGKCGRCEYRHVCGGCRARAYAATGDYLASEPLCAYGSSEFGVRSSE